MTKSTPLLAFSAAAFLAACGGSPPPPAAPLPAPGVAARIDSIFSFATPATPGCAVGVSQNGRTVVDRTYGLADVERGIPLGSGSVFDIGSVQKQFVAAAVLVLVEDGRLALTDDVRKHVPELPDYGHTVTLDHLLTHTSGLRDWTGLQMLAPEGADVLQLILQQRGLNFVPGEEWSYSNSGYVLLKEIVARTSGMTFAEFARRRMFEPLGMRSSAYVSDILQVPGDRALAYQKEGDQWKEFMRLGSQRGGGAVVSTPVDLLRWNDALTNGRLGTFVTQKLEEPARLGSGRELTYTRGLIVTTIPGGRLVSHSGGAAGYSTWLGRFTDHGLSVAVMCNFEPVSGTALAGRVADLFLPPVDPAAAPAGPVAAPGVDVAVRAGTFFHESTGQPLLLAANNGRLTVANGPPLVAVSEERFRTPRASLFFRSEEDVELVFRSDDLLELRSPDGRTDRYRRAEPWTPTAADLQGVEGRYESTEVGTVFELLRGANGLVMRFEDAPERSIELTPVDRDTWMLRLMFVRLRRDASGTVVGFDYGNPVVRSVAFTRVGGLAPAAPRAAAPEAAAAPPLEALVGAYELAPGRILNVALHGGRLVAQPAGGDEGLPLTHVSGATFLAGEGPITLTFTPGADGRATAIVMRQNGPEMTLPRVR